MWRFSKSVTKKKKAPVGSKDPRMGHVFTGSVQGWTAQNFWLRAIFYIYIQSEAGAKFCVPVCARVCLCTCLYHEGKSAPWVFWCFGQKWQDTQYSAYFLRYLSVKWFINKSGHIFFYSLNSISQHSVVWWWWMLWVPEAQFSTDLLKAATATCQPHAASAGQRVAKYEKCKLSMISSHAEEPEKPRSHSYSRCFFPPRLSHLLMRCLSIPRLIRHHKHTITNAFLALKK